MSAGRTLLVLGDDKLGRLCHARLCREGGLPGHVDVALDRSSDFRRVFRLILSGRLPLRSVMAMAWAELLRRDPGHVDSARLLTNNAELRKLLEKNKYTRVLLFRAGLIISGQTLSLGIPFHNVHCASIPEYSGLASIWRALRDGRRSQEAALHVVTTTIDDPSDILGTEPYMLDPAESYARNEDRAYEAGIRLMLRTLKEEAPEG